MQIIYINKIIPKNNEYSCVTELLKNKCTYCTHANDTPAEFNIACIPNWFVLKYNSAARLKINKRPFIWNKTGIF